MVVFSSVLRGAARTLRNSLAAVGLCTAGYMVYEYKGVLGSAQEPNDQKKRVLVLPFDELTIVETTDGLPGGKKNMMELRHLVNALHKAASDPSIVAVYGKFGVAPVATDMASLEEIRTALMVIQQAHRRHAEPNIHHTTQIIPKIDPKPLYAFAADGLSDQSYYLASVFTDLHLQKNADLILWGNSSTSVFLKDWFYKNKLQVHVFKHAEYKTAANLFTHRTYDKFHHQQASMLHQTMQQIMISDIMASRSKALLSSWMGKVQWDDIFKSGSFPANSAWKGGLVDYLPRRDPLPELLKNAGSKDLPQGWCPSETSFEKFKADKEVSLQQYVKEVQLIERKERFWQYVNDLYTSVTNNFELNKPRQEKVALVHVNGMIHGNSIKNIVESIREIRENESMYKCLVLRVNSGGGSITACETLLQELKSLEIPVIASFGDKAASGGYYISSHADRIFANRMTKTGSIGIFGIRLDATDFLQSYGVQVETIDTSPLSSTLNPAVPMTRPMKQNFSNMIDRFYEQFKSTVSTGRKLENVEDLAAGRVFLGDTAKSNGLVDELGGLHRALAYASREFGGTDIVVFPKPQPFLQRLAEARDKTPSMLAQQIMSTSGNGIYLTTDEATALGCLMEQAQISQVASWFADANW